MKLAFLKKSSLPIDFSYFPNIVDHPKTTKNILKNYYQTPVFITDKDIIKKRLNQIPKNVKVAYSYKTNYDIAKNFNFQLSEVVSKFELEMALKQKYSYESIIFNGPNKGNLHQILSQPLTINIDNFTELKSLFEYKKNINAKIGIRINSDFHPSRFGFNIESGDAKKAISLLHEHHIPLSGLHIHIGSDIHQPKTYQKYSNIVSSFISKYLSQNTLKYIDFGGGFPSHSIIPGSEVQSQPDIKRYIDAISIPLKKHINRKISLIIEPGRFLVDDSTIMVSKVIDSKLSANSQSVTLDTTINMLPSAWYHKLIIKTYNQDFSPQQNISSKVLSTKIFGCTCQESDLLYQDILPPLFPNDFVIFFAIGAYNLNQSPDFIFKKPRSIFI
ncbi:MAG TPA: hypothetical protein VN174_01725 [Candidatus Methanoperedens sp.]|nr:hypothetical protein [Candidatus Methanoperedens sp.]